MAELEEKGGGVEKERDEEEVELELAAAALVERKNNEVQRRARWMENESKIKENNDDDNKEN